MAKTEVNVSAVIDAGSLNRYQIGVFFLCGTQTTDGLATISHRWITDPSELKEMELFHPLVADLIGHAQREELP